MTISEAIKELEILKYQCVINASQDKTEYSYYVLKAQALRIAIDALKEKNNG